jgi:ribose 5-phosphate isomerase B
MKPETLAFAADHGGYDLKAVLMEEAGRLGCNVLDLGAYSRESVDYPDIADTLAQALRDGRATRGVAICGTGIGISIAANRHAHIRAGLCHDATTARLTRQHNDANVLALGGRVIGEEVAKECLRVFLATGFEGKHHARRVEKLGRARESAL